MPAVVDPARCNKNWDQCFSARICPESAFSLIDDGTVQIAWERCCDCPGPCVNFCDGYAIMYDRNPGTFDVLRREVLGDISQDDALKQRLEVIQAQEEATKSSSPVIEVTLESFQGEVLDSPLPVIADFWAPWCGPCRKMAPIFEDLAGEYQDRIKFVKINTEVEVELAQHFRISSIPTLMVFADGQVVDGSVGALPRAQLASLASRVESTFATSQQATTDVEIP